MVQIESERVQDRQWYPVFVLWAQSGVTFGNIVTQLAGNHVTAREVLFNLHNKTPGVNQIVKPYTLLERDAFVQQHAEVPAVQAFMELVLHAQVMGGIQLLADNGNHFRKEVFLEDLRPLLEADRQSGQLAHMLGIFVEAIDGYPGEIDDVDDGSGVWLEQEFPWLDAEKISWLYRTSELESPHYIWLDMFVPLVNEDEKPAALRVLVEQYAAVSSLYGFNFNEGDLLFITREKARRLLVHLGYTGKLRGVEPPEEEPSQAVRSWLFTNVADPAGEDTFVRLADELLVEDPSSTRRERATPHAENGNGASGAVPVSGETEEQAYGGGVVDFEPPPVAPHRDDRMTIKTDQWRRFRKSVANTAEAAGGPAEFFEPVVEIEPSPNGAAHAPESTSRTKQQRLVEHVVIRKWPTKPHQAVPVGEEVGRVENDRTVVVYENESSRHTATGERQVLDFSDLEADPPRRLVDDLTPQWLTYQFPWLYNAVVYILARKAEKSGVNTIDLYTLGRFLEKDTPKITKLIGLAREALHIKSPQKQFATLEEAHRIAVYLGYMGVFEVTTPPDELPPIQRYWLRYGNTGSADQEAQTAAAIAAMMKPPEVIVPGYERKRRTTKPHPSANAHRTRTQKPSAPGAAGETPRKQKKPEPKVKVHPAEYYLQLEEVLFPSGWQAVYTETKPEPELLGGTSYSLDKDLLPQIARKVQQELRNFVAKYPGEDDLFLFSWMLKQAAQYNLHVLSDAYRLLKETKLARTMSWLSRDRKAVGALSKLTVRSTQEALVRLGFEVDLQGTSAEIAQDLLGQRRNVREKLGNRREDFKTNVGIPFLLRLYLLQGKPRTGFRNFATIIQAMGLEKDVWVAH